MTKIYVVYHSGYGHTKLQAEAVARGAGAELMSVDDVDFDKLDHADAIIFGAPTYLGSVSAQFKEFMDSSSKAWYAQKWRNKVTGGFTNSSGMSGDKLSTLMQIAIFAAQHSMIWVSAGHEPDLDRFGSTLGLMCVSENAPAGPDNPPQIDIKCAEKYGQRIAEITRKLKA